MKTKFWLLIVLTILLQANTESFAREMANARRIELSVKAKGRHRSLPVVPVTTIEGALVSVDFLVMVPSATISIKDAETGEVVYSSVEQDATRVDISLAGETAGRYVLEIETQDNIFSGELDLEY